MASFQIREFIHRPAHEVFDFMAGENESQGQAQTLSAKWTAAPVGAGSIKHVVTRSMGREIRADIEYTRWDPPHQYSFKSLGLPFPIKGIQGTVTLASQENGTQLTLDGQVEAVGVFRLLEGLIASQAKKQDASNMNALKRLLEAG